jgi:hypothetical protein
MLKTFQFLSNKGCDTVEFGTSVSEAFVASFFKAEKTSGSIKALELIYKLM